MMKPDLTAYVLGELAEAERVQADRYLASNADAAAEVERLRLVVSGLKRLPEEEPPRRIAFVSDKVFEPKWHQRFWRSGPQLGFASAAMLAIAILAHGAMSARRPAAPPPDVAAIVEAEMNQRVSRAVAEAAAAVRAESDAKARRLVAAALDEAERKFAIERRADRLAVEASFDILRKQMNRMLYLASNERGAQ